MLHRLAFTCCTLTLAGISIGEKFCFTTSQILSQCWRNGFQRYLNQHRTMIGMGIYFRIALCDND